MGGSTYSFAYNGLGDRLQQGVDGVTSTYALDLNAWLIQVLSDGTNAYLYGLGRIGEEQPSGWTYHLPDALGSVRQLANEASAAILAKAYQPFGSPLNTAGLTATSYGFTGEWTDATGLVHLRARTYDPRAGRFIQADPFAGFDFQPRTLHPYLYAFNNPIRYVDPTGQIPLIVPVLAFALLGGGINYAGQVLNNIQSGRRGADAFFNCINLWDVGISAASAAVATVVFLAISPLATTTTILLEKAWLGFMAGGLSSLAGQLTSNLLTPGVPLHHQLLPALAMGGVSGALAFGLLSVLRPAAGPLSAFGRGFLGGSISLGTGQLVYNLLTPNREWHEDVVAAGLIGGFVVGTVEAVRYSRAQTRAATDREVAGARQQPGTRPTPDDISRIESYLEQFGRDKPNSQMIARLKDGSWSIWDQRFATHELLEIEFVSREMSQEAAHLLALSHQGMGKFPGFEAYLFHPEVIRAYPEYFSPAAQRLSELLSSGR